VSRRVLVTGAASGLGAALVDRFRADGDRVLATDVSVADVPGPDVSEQALRRLDVRSLEDWQATRDWAEQHWGGLDLLVNNAGIATGGRIDVASIAEWQRVLDVNLLGVVRGCQTFVPGMKAGGGGHIVNIASMAGLVHPPHMGSYNAAKAGVVALSETLLHELEPHGIAVTVVCPSFFRTNLAASLDGDDVEAHAAARRLIEGSRTTADEIARQVIDAVQRQRFLLVTDRQGRAAHLAKRFAPPLYRRTMRRISRTFHRRVEQAR